MDEQMLEQIQQMITTATESLRQEMTGIATGLGHKITGLDQSVTGLDQKITGLDQRLTGVDERVTGLDQKVTGLDQKVTGLDQKVTGLAGELRQEMAAMKTELRDDIADGKRYAGILAEDLQHKLELVLEGQQFLGQRIENGQADMDAKNRETRAFLELS